MEKETMEIDVDLRNLMFDLESYVPAISAAELMNQPFAPTEYVVKGLLPKGLSILGGAPKIGKSWLVLDLCIHIAQGEKFWGMDVQQGTAWYLCLEDKNDRVRQRMACITADALNDLQISSSDYNLGTMADGLEETFHKFMRKYQNTRLIVIDTFQMVRGHNKEPTYGGDYSDAQKLKQIADKYNIAILLVHHLRKMPDKDPVNKLSGTTGLSGAADTLFILDKSDRLEDVATLTCTGRDIQQRKLDLRFDRANFVWNKISDSADRDAPTLPPDMVAFAEFMKSIGSYEGGNTALAELFAQHSGITMSAKILKQKLNRWCCPLSDLGISFSSKELHSGKVVSVHYTPPVSHASQVSQDSGA